MRHRFRQPNLSTNQPFYNNYHLFFDITKGFVNIAGSINSVRWRPLRQGKRKGFSF